MVYVSITNDELLDNKNENKGEKEAQKSKAISINGGTKSLSSNSLSDKIKRKKVFFKLKIENHVYERYYNFVFDNYFVISGQFKCLNVGIFP